VVGASKFIIKPETDRKRHSHDEENHTTCNPTSNENIFIDAEYGAFLSWLMFVLAHSSGIIT
jgi:hypothetical protein